MDHYFEKGQPVTLTLFLPGKTIIEMDATDLNACLSYDKCTAKHLSLKRRLKKDICLTGISRSSDRVTGSIV